MPIGAGRSSLVAEVTSAIVAIMLVVAVIPSSASAKEPKPDRHEWLGVSCQGTEASLKARTKALTRDMKNNNSSRIPGFYRIKTKTQIDRLAIGSQWRRLDSHEVNTWWLERRGNWIVKRYSSPPFYGQGRRGSQPFEFGDSTGMASPGMTIRAKVTVTLDKKPGGKVWKYTKTSQPVYCESDRAIGGG
ncbi:MAG: hypothetical protein KDC39_08530 [Actinobacteria bacterium]|nr:hypothetical protein [Actinomycetota bacterium]